LTVPTSNDFELWRDADTVMWVNTAHRQTLLESGLARFEDFRDTTAGEVVNRHGVREVVRLTLTGCDGPRTVYLKRFGPTHLKDALKDLVRLRRVRTPALVECTMLRALRDAGFGAPAVIACGERHVLGRDRASFVMVDALNTGRPLDEVLKGLADPARRRGLLAATASFVRRLHAAGFSHGDLFAKHLFVSREDDGDWSVSVIDLARGRRDATTSPARRARDLAALMVSIDPGVTSVRERRTFLLEYLGADRLGADHLRFVRQRILPRAGKLSHRAVYRAWQPLLEHA